MGKDYLRGYSDGLADAEASAAHAERLRAIAAIRRVAAVARQAEQWSGVSAYEGFVMAKGVRAAVRAAIGSNKT